jgi:cobalt-zinc-cadmium efflux system protein
VGKSDRGTVARDTELLRQIGLVKPQLVVQNVITQTGLFLDFPDPWGNKGQTVVYTVVQSTTSLSRGHDGAAASREVAVGGGRVGRQGRRYSIRPDCPVRESLRRVAVGTWGQGHSVPGAWEASPVGRLFRRQVGLTTHRHHHVDPDAGDARVMWAIAVNIGLTFAQLIGGLAAGSLALVADALHNFSDAISLVIAFIARKIRRREADAVMTFGYARAETVAALVNYTTLVLIGLYLVYESLMRFINPPGVDGWLVVIIAGFALAVDTITALLTYRLSKTSMNMRAAFLHNLADALGSIAVIVAGTLILMFDWRLIDPLVTLMIAIYVLWQSLQEIGPVIRILMLGSPPNIDAAAVVEAMKSIDGVEDVHHVHFWQLDEHTNSVDAHVVIGEGQWDRADAIKAQVKQSLESAFEIRHTTLEIECTHHACEDAEEFGHEVHNTAGAH